MQPQAGARHIGAGRVAARQGGASRSGDPTTGSRNRAGRPRVPGGQQSEAGGFSGAGADARRSGAGQQIAHAAIGAGTPRASRPL